jgi:indolepyruvate decarboxylase
MAETRTIASLLLERLHGLGLRHIFGVPGDYVLTLYKLIAESPIQHIGTTREDTAGFAADAYARIHGIGGACVTYCVGGLNIVNAIACAYAERSPVVLLSGSPGLAERVRHPFLHHMVQTFSTQKEVFEKVTCAAVVLDDPLTAERDIDQALAALQRYRRPIYLEIPRDLVYAPIDASRQSTARAADETDRAALTEAVAEVREMLSQVDRPVVLAGAEVHRFGLQHELTRIVERMNVPVASTLMGKSVIREDHPLYLGVYNGLIGREEVQEFADKADCLIMLGSILTDIDDIRAHATLLAQGRTVHATADGILIKHHRYEHVRFDDFVRALATAPMPSFPTPSLPTYETAPAPAPLPSAPVTLRSLFAYLAERVNDKTLIIADVGEALFAAADLRVRHCAEFLSPAYYTSMGFAVPAALGAGVADPSLRPLVLVGDGAFQMTGTELSTCLRYGQNPIVIVLNNRGYSTEREMLDGPFNDVHEWQYEQICTLIGGGVGHRIRTDVELLEALDAAFSDPPQLHVLNVLLDPADRSPAMVRLAQRLAKRLVSEKTSPSP